MAKKNKLKKQIPPTQADIKTSAVQLDTIISAFKGNIHSIALFIISLIVNLIVVADYSNSPFSKIPCWDAEIYWKWAQTIVAGNWLGNIIFHQAPLYPYFLSVSILLFGKNLLAIYIIQAIMSAVSVVLIFLITKKLTKRISAGISAALLFAFFGMQVFYITKILSECLSIFLLLTVTWLLVADTFSKKRIISAGIVFGLLLIAKPQFLVVVPVILAFLFLQNFREKLRYSMIITGLFLLPIIIIVGSVGIRNYAVGKDFVLISSNGGENFFIGNNGKANGCYQAVEGISPDIEYQNQDVNSLAELKARHHLKRSEVSSYWFRQGVDFIFSQPYAFLKLEWLKFKFMFSGAEHSTMYYLYFEKHNITKTFTIPFVSYYLLLTLFGVGFFIALRQWRTYLLPNIFMLANMLNILIFFYDTRFMLLSMPFWAILGGLAISQIAILFKNNRLQKICKQPVMLILFLGLALSYFIFAFDQKVKKPDWHMQMTLGDIYLDLNDLDAALKAYTQSSYLKQNDWMPIFGVCKVYFLQNKKELSAQLYNEAFPNLNADFKKLILRDKDLDPVRQYIKEHTAAIADSLPDKSVPVGLDNPHS